MKSLSPKEAGYAIQLNGYTLLDVRPSSERSKVRVINCGNGIICLHLEWPLSGKYFSTQIANGTPAWHCSWLQIENLAF